jgi:signal transduction histidine kinase
MYSALSVAAHEIRGPMSIIATIIDMIEPETGDDSVADRAELFEVMRAQCRLIQQVTSDLSVAGQHRKQGIALTAEPREVLPALRIAAAAFARQADVLVTCPLDLVAHVDEVRLHQMIGNLLSNAVKYGEPPIRLIARAAPGRVEFRVVDSGPGVPDEFRPLLFEPFARAAGRSCPGTGLGLSVVRTLAEAHGGTAWYEDVPGGAAFCFSVPDRP